MIRNSSCLKGAILHKNSNMGLLFKDHQCNEPVFQLSEFSFRCLLIFEDQILVVDIRRKILRCISETILISEDNAHFVQSTPKNQIVDSIKVKYLPLLEILFAHSAHPRSSDLFDFDKSCHKL